MDDDESSRANLINRLGLTLPKWCQLRVAVMWVVDGTTPLSYDDNLHRQNLPSLALSRYADAKDAFLLALRNGLLSAQGNLEIFSSKHPSFKKDYDFSFSFQGDWKKFIDTFSERLGQNKSDFREFFDRNVDIPSELWSYDLINWASDCLVSPSMSELQARFLTVCVPTERVRELFLRTESQVVEDKKILLERRGRKPKYDWEAFYIHLAVIADLDGLPENQADTIRRMSEWCLQEWGEEPAESTLKEKIAPLYRHPRKAKKSR